MRNQRYNAVLRRKRQAKYTRYVKGEPVGQVLDEILGCKHNMQTAFVKFCESGWPGNGWCSAIFPRFVVASLYCV